MLTRMSSALVVLTIALSTVCAEEKAVLTERADALFKAGDTDSSGKLEWKEVFKRWSDFNASLKIAQEEDDERMERRVREFYADLLEPLDYLVADANDDLVVSRQELLDWVKLDEVATPYAGGKLAKPSRKDLETFCTAMVEAAWPGLLKLVDADNDTKISRAELEARYPVEVDDKYFKAADKNNDGKLVQAEYVTFKVEEHERGLFVEFDADGGEVGVGGGACDSVESGDEGKQSPKDESKKTEVKATTRLRVGTTWSYKQGRLNYDKGSPPTVDWAHHRVEITSATEPKDDCVELVFRFYVHDARGEWVIDAGRSGSCSVSLGNDFGADVEKVKITVGAGTFDCGPKKEGTAKGGFTKEWSTFFGGMLVTVKREFEGELIYELLEFKY